MSVALARVESWDDHVEAWHHFGRQADGALWGRAEIAASVKRQYRDNGVERFADQVKCKKSAIYYLIKTFEAFPELSTRVESLTFSHHRLAAELTSSAKEAKAAVEHAAAEGWKTPALRAYLNPPARETAAEMSPSCSTDAGTCGPLTRRDKTAHIAGLVESLHQSMRLFEAVKSYDLDPLVEHGTKKSLKELIAKIDNISEWLGSLRAAAKRRTQ